MADILFMWLLTPLVALRTTKKNEQRLATSHGIKINNLKPGLLQEVQSALQHVVSMLVVSKERCFCKTLLHRQRLSKLNKLWTASLGQTQVQFHYLLSKVVCILNDALA